MKKGMLVIVSGPAGSGKDTVLQALDTVDRYCLSVSVTTRPRRDYEIDGVHYFFVTKERFADLRDSGGLLEHIQYCNEYYGVPKSYVEEKIDEGRVVILKIEVNGALRVKELFPDAVLIFLMPPSVDELKRRLRDRGTETEDKLGERLATAVSELKLMKDYEYLVVNDIVEEAARRIDTIVEAEKMKVSRCETEFEI